MFRSPRFVLYLVLLMVAFLLGYVPMWLKVRVQNAAREKAEHTLTLTRIVKDLGSAAIDARRAQYEAARVETSAFFTAARFEIDQRERSTLSPQQRDGLAAQLGSRDDLITLLARGDPSSADRLSALYVAVRKAVGN